ncbi:hypothetical protein [Hydrogenimonas urashimensis]|uniref:hypothetical protein n=1 Tax=Hydrogenimonas urashimensis TaxID=2740515 RepID=UPI001915D425|nr:hypothetical protein [Hydrogenimonas urashimensis]
MSLFLSSVIEALQSGDYRQFRHIMEKVGPTIFKGKMPQSLLEEARYGELNCGKNDQSEPLFPIRFMWLLEMHEQRMFGLQTLGRSMYHPEKLYALWQKATSDASYRKELEEEGIRFDLKNKAILLPAGWVYIGEHFVEDFIEIERFYAKGKEILYPDPETGEMKPVFHEFKKASGK